MQQTGTPGNVESVPVETAVSAVQKTAVIDQGVSNDSVVDDLSQINSEIAQVNSSPSTSNERTLDRTKEPLPDREQSLQPKLIHENTAPKLVSHVAQGPGDFSRPWIILMAIGAVLIFALREWVWQRRFKKLNPVPVSKKSTQPRQKKKPSTYKSSSENTGEIELKDLKETKKDSAKSLGGAEIYPLVLESHTIDDVKLECDTLNAYELYPEALQLVRTSRDKLGDNPWLDFKELEVLASAGQFDEFFECYEQYKQRLEQELPDFWTEIENIRKQLQEDFKITAVR